MNAHICLNWKKKCEYSRHKMILFGIASKQERERESVFCESNWLKDKIIIKKYTFKWVWEERKKNDTNMNCLSSNYAVHMTHAITLNNRQLGITKIRDISHKSLFWYDMQIYWYVAILMFVISQSNIPEMTFYLTLVLNLPTIFLFLKIHEYSTWNDSRVTPTITIINRRRKRRKKNSSGTFFSLCLISN